VRYYVTEIVDGKPKRVQRSHQRRHGVSSFAIARFIVLFISATTAGTSR